MRKSRHKDVQQLATGPRPWEGARSRSHLSLPWTLPPYLHPHSKYLDGGRGCGHLLRSQGAPPAGNTSLPGDETVAGLGGAVASLVAVGVRKQGSAPQGQRLPFHRSGQGRALIMPTGMQFANPYHGLTVFPVSSIPSKPRR